MSDFRWQGDELDLDAYLRRIGLDGAGGAAPDLGTLRAVMAGHVASIPFENVEVLLGRPVLLDVPALERKLVRQPRGGYCYEHNLLLAAALDRLGFEVTGLGARVRMGADKINPTTHMLLRVDLGGEPWHVDVGFGGEALLEPLPLAAGAEVTQGAWTFSVTDEGDSVRVLRGLHADGWFPLYAYTLEPRHRPDYEVWNHYISTHPRSPFTSRLVVQQPGREQRLALVGDTLTTIEPGGEVTKRTVAPEELPGVLGDFGLAFDAADTAALIRHAAARRAADTAESR
ncbi:arylamine N-acetyltransferase [Streptomyces sp. A7024]|uniref:Arylamine N-acetyltransferase n=1 Tax=Streptomyces coryli TaxID=1128680 RepID=A0A6G4UAI0_9ACTN|nr:arylamine N-acetyltransferase [Streptomyces coryli]NGN68327.1 arylamine N-acetyltransferase [Streptomyces coryli]